MLFSLSLSLSLYSFNRCSLPECFSLFLSLSLSPSLSFFISLYLSLFISLSLLIFFSLSISPFYSFPLSACFSISLSFTIFLFLFLSLSLSLYCSLALSLSLFFSFSLSFFLDTRIESQDRPIHVTPFFAHYLPTALDAKRSIDICATWGLILAIDKIFPMWHCPCTLVLLGTWQKNGYNKVEFNPYSKLKVKNYY
jgi:hypothetical protein